MKLSTFVLAALCACGGGTTETETAAPAPAPAPTPSASAAAAPYASASAAAIVAGKLIAIPQLHLSGAALGKVGSINVHPGAAGAMTVDTDAFSVNVGAPGQFDPKTIDQARQRARSYSGRNEHAETLPDGWSFTFENEAVFFGDVSRTIAGRPYFCSISQPTSERRDRAVAFCKSLAQQ